MKKQFLSTIAFCLLFVFGMLEVQAQNSSAAQLKSIHLFDMPEGVTEAELAAVLEKTNAAIKQIGYKDAGYFLYKVEGESPEKYHYFFEGVWPSAEVYKKVHEDKRFMESDKQATELIKKIQAVELYRRLKRVN